MHADDAAASLTLSSPAFKQNTEVPARYSCDGADQSPALSWRGAPTAVKSFALIVDDPDAPVGTWVHWVVYDLPAETTELPAGVPRNDRLPNGAQQGVNDFHKAGYNGPCPPPGAPHRYFFKLYALDTPTGLRSHAAKAELLHAMDGHVLAHAELIGIYKR